MDIKFMAHLSQAVPVLPILAKVHPRSVPITPVSEADPVSPSTHTIHLLGMLCASGMLSSTGSWLSVRCSSPSHGCQ